MCKHASTAAITLPSQLRADDDPAHASPSSTLPSLSINHDEASRIDPAPATSAAAKPLPGSDRPGPLGSIGAGPGLKGQDPPALSQCVGFACTATVSGMPCRGHVSGLRCCCNGPVIGQYGRHELYNSCHRTQGLWHCAGEDAAGPDDGEFPDAFLRTEHMPAEDYVVESSSAVAPAEAGNPR